LFRHIYGGCTLYIVIGSLLLQNQLNSIMILNSPPHVERPHFGLKNMEFKFTCKLFQSRLVNPCEERRTFGKLMNTPIYTLKTNPCPLSAVPFQLLLPAMSGLSSCTCDMCHTVSLQWCALHLSQDY